MPSLASSLRLKTFTNSIKHSNIRGSIKPGIECCCNALPFTRGTQATLGPSALKFFCHCYIGTDSTRLESSTSLAGPTTHPKGRKAQPMAQDMASSYHWRALPHKLVDVLLHERSIWAVEHDVYASAMLDQCARLWARARPSKFTLGVPSASICSSGLLRGTAIAIRNQECTLEHAVPWQLAWSSTEK